MTKLTDFSKMPFGKYAYWKLIDVPAEHLIWVSQQPWFKQETPLGVYIKENKEVLEAQINKNKNLNR